MRYNIAAFEMVPDGVKGAAKAVSEFLQENGVPHAVIGGMAVSAYSSPRMTKDVDFVVPHDALATIRELGDVAPLADSVDGVTVDVGDIPVDFLFTPSGFDESFLENGPSIDGISVLRLEALISMKLRAMRSKDLTDVVEMAKTRSPEEINKIRKWLKKNDPEVLDDFEAQVMIAEFEKSPDFNKRKKSARSKNG